MYAHVRIMTYFYTKQRIVAAVGLLIFIYFLVYFKEFRTDALAQNILPNVVILCGNVYYKKKSLSSEITVAGLIFIVH